jgi:hypothetical protein
MGAEKYIRKPAREDTIERAKQRESNRLLAKSLQRQIDAIRNDHGSLSGDEVAAIRERVAVGRYRWGRKGL